MTTYYSQHGEDFLLDRMFAHKPKGFFVEVGCIDGRRFSNTLTFEERGWKGLCIEAHTDYIHLLKRNRPHSIICHCAVGEMDFDLVTFYANPRGSLSTLDPDQEYRFKKEYPQYFNGFTEQQVPLRKLASIFEEHDIQEIDILSLDIEGYEVKALMGMDFSAVKPVVMVIESDSEDHERNLDDILIPHGYKKSVRLDQNLFYISDPEIDRPIREKHIIVRLTHTRHPLDEDGDRVTKVYITTSTMMIFRYVKRILNSILRFFS